MALRWRVPLVLAVVLLTGACAATSARTAGAGNGGGSGSGGGSASIVPFDTFLAGVTSATYQQYANLPGTKVSDAAAFGEMRAYLLDKYRGARVSRTFAESGGLFDCIEQAAATGGAGSCPAGSIPTRRVTLADLVRYANLQQFLGKAPGGGQLPPLSSGPPG